MTHREARKALGSRTTRRRATKATPKPGTKRIQRPAPLVARLVRNGR